MEYSDSDCPVRKLPQIEQALLLQQVSIEADTRPYTEALAAAKTRNERAAAMYNYQQRVDELRAQGKLSANYELTAQALPLYSLSGEALRKAYADALDDYRKKHGILPF